MRKLEDDNFVYVSGTVKAITDAALLLAHEHGEAWIPLSQIESGADCSKGEEVELLISTWLAEAKEIAVC